LPDDEYDPTLDALLDSLGEPEPDTGLWEDVTPSRHPRHADPDYDDPEYPLEFLDDPEPHELASDEPTTATITLAASEAVCDVCTLVYHRATGAEAHHQH
jgi:hypothetical protein